MNKKNYQTPELEITVFDNKNVLDDSVSGFWGSMDNFDDLMDAIAIGETYQD